MSGVTTILPRALTTDEEFRLIVAAFRQAFSDQGLIRTADTGQIDPSTVVRAAINTAAGYEIWRFNDALQATSSIFIKVEYGTGPSASMPGMWITVGTGSDGAGNITGTIIAREQLHSANANALSANTTISYFSSSPGRMCFVYNCSLSADSHSFGLALERGKDATGAEDGSVLIRQAGAYQGGTANKCRAFYLTGTNSANNRRSLPLIGPGNASGSGMVTKDGLDVLFGVPMYARPDKMRFATAWLSYASADLVHGALVSVPVLGTPKEVMPIYNSPAGPGWMQHMAEGLNYGSGISSGGAGLAMLWED